MKPNKTLLQRNYNVMFCSELAKNCITARHVLHTNDLHVYV